MGDWIYVEVWSKIDRCMILVIYDCYCESLIDMVKSVFVCIDMDWSVLKFKMFVF